MTPHFDTLKPPIYNCARTTTQSVDVFTFAPSLYRDKPQHSLTAKFFAEISVGGDSNEHETAGTKDVVFS